MTVKVMAGEAAVERKLPELKETENIGGQAGKEENRERMYIPPENMYISDNRRKHRARGSFGDVLFVQFVLSALLAVGVWAGMTFGDSRITEICTGIADLFG